MSEKEISSIREEFEDLRECQKIWDNVYGNSKKDSLPWEKAIPTEQIKSFLCELQSRGKNPNQLRILDFGCGTGRLGKYIETTTPFLKGNVYYYDISEKALNICKSGFGISSEQIVRLDATSQLPILTTENGNQIEVFDGIILWGVFHHLNEDLRNFTLKIVKRILAPNGVILVADFDGKDKLFNNDKERISEITDRKTYAINLNTLFSKDFNILQTGVFSFEECQEILSKKVKINKEKRLNLTRKISYALVEFSLLGKLKESVIKGFNNSDFSHFLEYKFLTSLNFPENSTSEYYDKSPVLSKKMWLYSMGLFAAYDAYKNGESKLINTSFSSLLFRQSSKRYSFIITSQITPNVSDIQINLSNKNILFTNLYELTLIVPKSIQTDSFEKEYFVQKGRHFNWNYSVLHSYKTENGYYKSALQQLEELSEDGFSLFDSKELSAIFSQLENSIDLFLKEHAELKDLKKAILMILLFVYPVNSNSTLVNSKITTQKTYIALVPPAFELLINKDFRQDYKEISAGGAIIYTNGDPFGGDSETKRMFLWNVLKWSSALTAKEVAEFTLRESIKAAKAAIMSRNMSHNLGSHVMSYIKQQLANEETLLGDTGVAIEDNIKGIINTNAGIHKEFPFLIGLGRFIGYLQERQDYIATISTDYIPYGAPVNMKDAIYDELNPDLKYFRHKNDSSESKRNRPANILLNYIAKSEGLAREYISESTTNVKNDIRFGYICYGKNGVSHTFYGLNENDGKEDSALAEMRKINFSLPGGLVGRQAVFSIIENLIRNAAKHGNKTGIANLDFVFDVIDGAHIESAGNRICDKKWCSLYQNASDIKDLYILTITNNLNETKETVETLRDKGLIDPFIGDDGRMNTANKGIKEIRISAAWIRGNTDEDAYYKYSDNTESAKLAPLVAVELAEGKHLRYAICIPKQKVVAIVPEVTVGEKTYVIDKDSLQKFQEFERSDADTWTILSESELLKRKTSFSFIIIPNDDTAYNKLRPYTSNRLMKWIRGKANLENEEQSLKYIYQYYTGIGDNPVIPIHIWDELTHTSHGGKDSESIALYRNEHSFEELAGDQDNALIILSKNDLEFNKLKGEQFIYRKHHSNRNDFIAFFEKIKGIKNNNQNSQFDDNTKPPILKCVEAITGDNSSDRLVRREKLDVFWYYKHLYAMKKKVAIIDERLFKYAHGIDESQLIFSNTVDERPQELTIDEVKNKVSDIDNDKLSVMIGFLDDPNEQKLNDVSDIDDLKKHGIETISLEILTKVFPNVFMAENTIPLNKKSNEGISHLTPYYAGKGVDVFTVIDDGENSMSLVGCTIHTGERKEKEFVFHNTFEKIAVFSIDEKSGKTLNVNFLNENFQHHYDYISIHQGILDKIYERLGIKDDDGKKCEITNCLYENMIRDNKAIGTYLPCLIIHSGRAKPNANDMPQKQPFLQYSAIENAVKDSKLILIELLDYAKYE